MKPMRAPRCLGSAAIVVSGLRRGLEQQVVDDRLVLIGDVGDLRRQREHHMKVRHRQQIGLALGQPLAGRSALALRAMPVAAAVVGDDGVGAGLVLAARHMAAERRRAAALDRLMTFNWPRLTWPALARRHAAPWSRKISATSSAGRDTAPGRYAGGGFFRLFLGLREAATAGRAGFRSPRSCRWRRGYRAPSCRACRDRAVMSHNTHPRISLKLKGLLRGI